MRIERRRVYDPAQPDDGFRVLVDRLWPRGVSQERAAIDLWAKDVTPSPELRKAWHAAPPEEWDAYAADYRVELAANPAVDAFVATLREHDVVTLVFAAHDPEHNHVVILMEALHARGLP